MARVTTTKSAKMPMLMAGLPTVVAAGDEDGAEARSALTGAPPIFWARASASRVELAVGPAGVEHRDGEGRDELEEPEDQAPRDVAEDPRPHEVLGEDGQQDEEEVPREEQRGQREDELAELAAQLGELRRVLHGDVGIVTTRSGASLLTGPPPGRLGRAWCLAVSAVAAAADAPRRSCGGESTPLSLRTAGHAAGECHGRSPRAAPAGAAGRSVNGADGSPCAGSAATNGRVIDDERSRPSAVLADGGAVPRSGWNEPRLRSMCSGACSRTIVCATCSGAVAGWRSRRATIVANGERHASPRQAA